MANALWKLPDGYIEHWGNVFVANNLFDKGIVFAAFLLNPQEMLDSVIFGKPMPLNGEFYPLLPEQLAVKAKVEEADLAELLQDDMDKDFERKGHVVELHGNRIIEPIHHRVAPKKWKTTGRA